MIKLTKSNINTLIARYFEEEGYVYTKFTFTAEAKFEMEHLRKNLDLVSLVAMGMQYLYGVEHYTEEGVAPCDVLYTLLEDHRCETVRGDVPLEIKLAPESEEEVRGTKKGRPRKTRRKESHEECQEDEGQEEEGQEKAQRKAEKKKNKRLKRQLEKERNKEEELEGIKEELKEGIKEEDKKREEEDKKVDDPVPPLSPTIPTISPTPTTTPSPTTPLVGSLKSDVILEFTDKSLTECTEAERITWNGDYLGIKTLSNELFAYKFGIFVWRQGISDLSTILWNELGLVTGEESGRVVILNPSNYRRRVFEKHTDVITRLLFRDKKVFSCSKDGFLHSTDDSVSLKVFPEGIQDALLLENWLIFCVSFEGSLAVVDSSLKRLEGHGSRVTSLGFWDQVVSTGSEDGQVSVYDTLGDRQVFFMAHPGGVSFLCWVQGFLATAGKDNIIKLWSMQESGGLSLRELSRFQYPGQIKTMKSNKEFLALIADDQTISLFDHHMGLISRYSLVGSPRDFDFSESGDSICVLLDNSYPVIINLIKSDPA